MVWIWYNSYAPEYILLFWWYILGVFISEYLTSREDDVMHLTLCLKIMLQHFGKRIDCSCLFLCSPWWLLCPIRCNRQKNWRRPTTWTYQRKRWICCTYWIYGAATYAASLLFPHWCVSIGGEEWYAWGRSIEPWGIPFFLIMHFLHLSFGNKALAFLLLYAIYLPLQIMLAPFLSFISLYFFLFYYLLCCSFCQFLFCLLFSSALLLSC